MAHASKYTWHCPEAIAMLFNAGATASATSLAGFSSAARSQLEGLVQQREAPLVATAVASGDQLPPVLASIVAQLAMPFGWGEVGRHLTE